MRLSNAKIMKAVVFTLGCKVNECESDSLISGLEKLGYEVSDKLVKADLYIVNTCAVTGEAEKKSRQTASRIKKLNKNAKIIFTGCASQKNPQAFLEKSGEYVITGTFNKSKILDLIFEKGIHLSPETKEYEEMPVVKPQRKRTYIKVQDGCNNFCTYCIIPYLRGRSRSRSPKSVLEEIKANNPVEVIINGINLTSYNYNGLGLTGLIDSLKSVDARTRLGSLETTVITEEFLLALKGLKNFAPHFHLSLQSGSNAVLKKMNRKYTREEFIEKVSLIRKHFDNAGITTDIIVGFPTETEQDFLDTLDLVDRVKFTDIHAFPFSKREGTVAYKMPDLNGEIKKSRLNKLLDKKAELKLEFINSNINKILDFIPEEEKEGYIAGYTQNYLRAYLPKPNKNLNGIVKVLVKAPYQDGVLVEIVND